MSNAEKKVMLDSFLSGITNEELETNERKKTIKIIKQFINKHSIESTHIILTHYSRKLIEHYRIEFKFKLQDDSPQMYSHFFSSQIYKKNKNEAKDITYHMAAEILDEMKFSLFVKTDESKFDDNDINFVPIDANGMEFEQGEFYKDKEGKEYMLMGWDKKRMYFYIDVSKKSSVEDQAMKSLPHKEFISQF